MDCDFPWLTWHAVSAMSELAPRDRDDACLSGAHSTWLGAWHIVGSWYWLFKSNH
jgi:hypothetical protein